MQAKFVLERKPLYELINVVGPIIFIGWLRMVSNIDFSLKTSEIIFELNLSVFGTLIPDDSGEKISFLITLTLALVFLSIELENKLAPPGELSMPIITWLITVNYIVLFLRIVFKVFFFNSVASILRKLQVLLEQIMSTI